jgi:methyl-accepting chemotaxis protein
MTIKKKLLLSSTLLTVLILAIGIILFLGYRYTTQQASTSNALDNEAKYLQMILRGVNEVIVTEGTPQSVSIVEEGIEGFEGLHVVLLDDLAGTDLFNPYTESVNTRWENIKTGIQPFLEHHLDTEADGLMIQYGKAVSQTDDLINKIDEFSVQSRALISSGSRKTQIIQYVIVFTLCITLGGVLHLLFKLYGSIISPIHELDYIAKGFGNGDLSITMKDTSKDEFGILAFNFNQATSKLNDFFSQIRNNINILSENTGELANKSTHIASNTREQSSQTTQAATAMEELSASFVDVARNAGAAANSAKEATDLAMSGGEIVEETTQGMVRISQSVKDSASTIETLGKNSEQIGEIIKVISDIAEQTNLLALNAAIEAARAGEQGRGFAVVADEVRSLAEKTTTATKEIGDMIKKIQEETSSAVRSMQTGTKDVDNGVMLANQAGQSLKQIVEAIQNVTDMIMQIATAAEEQSATGGEVVSNIESVAGITQTTANNAEESSAYSQQLNIMASTLRGMAEEFKLRSVN